MVLDPDARYFAPFSLPLCALGLDLDLHLTGALTLTSCLVHTPQCAWPSLRPTLATPWATMCSRLWRLASKQIGPRQSLSSHTGIACLLWGLQCVCLRQSPTSLLNPPAHIAAATLHVQWCWRCWTAGAQPRVAACVRCALLCAVAPATQAQPNDTEAMLRGVCPCHSGDFLPALGHHGSAVHKDTCVAATQQTAHDKAEKVVAVVQVHVYRVGTALPRCFVLCVQLVVSDSGWLACSTLVNMTIAGMLFVVSWVSSVKSR